MKYNLKFKINKILTNYYVHITKYDIKIIDNLYIINQKKILQLIIKNKIIINPRNKVSIKNYILSIFSLPQ